MNSGLPGQHGEAANRPMEGDRVVFVSIVYAAPCRDLDGRQRSVKSCMELAFGGGHHGGRNASRVQI